MFTNTSFKGRFYYLGLILLVILLSIYWVGFKKPNSVEQLEKNAFVLNYAAFKNGIRLANYQFLLKSAANPANKSITIDGLAYNSFGYPVAAQDDFLIAERPNSALQCRAIWQKVLGPLRPQLALSANESRYWVDITPDNHCVYRNDRVNDQQMLYDTVKGLVSIVNINS